MFMEKGLEFLLKKSIIKDKSGYYNLDSSIDFSSQFWKFLSEVNWIGSDKILPEGSMAT